VQRIDRKSENADRTVVDFALKRGRAALAHVGGFESAILIRSDREERDARDRDRCHAAGRWSAA